MSVRGMILLLLLALLGSCSEVKEPESVLSREQMVDLMMDIYLAEARTNLLPIERDSAYKLFLPFQDSLLHRKEIPDSLLKKSYAYYLQRPAELEAIYDAIIDSLSLREQLKRDKPVLHR